MASSSSAEQLGNCLTHNMRYDQFFKTDKPREPGIHKNNQAGDEVKEGFMNPLLPPCKKKTLHHYSLTRAPIRSTCGHVTPELRGRMV